MQPLSLDKFGEPLHRFPAFTATACNLRPREPRPCSPEERRPAGRAGDPAQLSRRPQPTSASPSTRSGWSAASCSKARAYAPYRPQELARAPTLVSDAELAHAAGDIGTTIFHPVGTCRMGDDAEAVVDPRLRLRGLAGLRIADASIMPTITSGNTNSPTVMIAEKAADIILQEYLADAGSGH